MPLTTKATYVCVLEKHRNPKENAQALEVARSGSNSSLLWISCLTLGDLSNSAELQFSHLQDGGNSLKCIFAQAVTCIGPYICTGPYVCKKNQLELTWAKGGSLTRRKLRPQRNRVTVDFTV